MNDTSASVPRPSPSMPNGLSTQAKSAVSMGPGASAVLTVVMPPATAAVQPAARQRGPGGAPVGNRSGTRLSKSTNAGKKDQVDNQATKSAAAGGLGRP